MTAISGKTIRERLAATKLAKRLVVSPLLEPVEQLRDDQASIDIRLGFQFAFPIPSSHGAIDEFEAKEQPSEQESKLRSLFRKEYIPIGNRLVLHPHEFLLASTLEYLRLPQDLMAYVLSRSTWGRLGLIVATAVGIQPGFAGSLTLEMRNLGESPITLYPGQAIAQLIFHKIEPVKASRADRRADESLGQYSGLTDILPRKLSAAATHKKLGKIVGGQPT